MYNFTKEKDNYFQLGRVIKTHGYKGEVVFLLDTDRPDQYSGLKMVFLNMEGSLVPWFIENIRINDNLAIVSLEDIKGPEQASLLLKKDIYLPADELDTMEGSDFYFHEIVGYSVHDKKHGDIGRLEEILDRPEQELLRILKGQKEILVPLTDEMIHKIDRKKKILHIKAPDGLIDLYLG